MGHGDHALRNYLSQGLRNYVSADIVAIDSGGLATFGAARLVWELLLPDQRTIPPAVALVRAGIDYKRAHGLPLTLFEMGIGK